MYLTVFSPQGQVTTTSLELFPLWRLGLVVHRRSVALALSYPNQSQTGQGSIIIAAVDCDTADSDLQPIVEKGLCSADRNVNKAAVRDEAQKLVNMKTQAIVNAIIEQLMLLVDVYHDLLMKFWGTDASLQTVVGATKGELGGYRWAVLKHRFEPWLSDAGAPVIPAAAFGAAPVGRSAPMSGASAEAFPPAPASTPPAAGSAPPPADPPLPGPAIPPVPVGRGKPGRPRKSSVERVHAALTTPQE